MKHRSRLGIVALATGLIVACSTAPNHAVRGGTLGEAEREHEEGPGNEPRKRFTGISQVGTVQVGGPAVPSPRTPGADVERLMSDYDDWEPAVAADPSGPYVYQFTTRYNRRAKVVYRVSADSGATWGPIRRISQVGRDLWDPQVAVAGDGTVFAMWLELPQWNTKLARSFDHGETWTEPVEVGSELPWTDHGWLVVSNDGQHVYVGINGGSSYVAASHDGGQTFGPVVLTESGDQDWLHQGGVVMADGTALVASTEYYQGYAGATNVHVLRSTNGGTSWDTIWVDRSDAAPACAWAPGCYRGFLAPSTGLAMDPAGTLMLAYNTGHTPRGAQQMLVRTSLDGVSWSEPVNVGQDSALVNNAFPVVVAGVNAGDFAVVWMADSGAESDWNVWMRRTHDSGATWGPFLRLSNRDDGARYKSPKGFTFPYGDYMSASADGEGRVHAIWGAGHNYNGPGGTWYTRAW